MRNSFKQSIRFRLRGIITTIYRLSRFHYVINRSINRSEEVHWKLPEPIVRMLPSKVQSGIELGALCTVILL